VARLQQANIVPLLTAGQMGGVPFYTMPFVAGLSLRQQLVERESKPYPIVEAISILRDVARALAYAHDAGVVHRDIKPENVLLSGGAAVVTDFGIAKAISAARTQTGTSATLTQAGAGIGTPAYMAPEQAAGDPDIDHRADIYAFGCLAYELLTGHPPFRGQSVHELISSHITEVPASVKSKRPDTPPALAALVDRCLEKRPDQRPQSARELLDALDTVATPTSRAFALSAGGISRRRAAVGLAVIGVALLATSAYVLVTRRARRLPVASEQMLAVIPFANVGGDSAQDYLADGISDELATAIGKLPGVHLAARSGAYRFRGRRDADVREIGKTLQARFVVQGTVRRLGDQLRISAQLSDAETGRELWSKSVDGTTKDVFRTQDDITSAIANALGDHVRGVVASAAPGAPPRAVAQGTTDADAYDLYMRGEFLLRLRQVQQASDMFQGAIARDTDFARAYAGLSQALALTPYFTSTPASAERVIETAHQALKRDSSLAEAHMSLGMAYMHMWRWDEARAAFERAVAADPSDPQTHFQFGRYFYFRGDDARALAEWRRMQAIDPFSALAAVWLGQLLLFQGKLPEALAEARRGVAYDSGAAVIKQLASRVYVAAGETRNGRELADRMPNVPPWSGMRAFVHASSGDPAPALAIVHDLLAANPKPWFVNGALAYAYLGLRDTSRALAALERATDAREIWPTDDRASDPIFDPVRKSARWAALVHRVGLDGMPGALPR
jgi:serine/threonine-protein kinase